MTPLVELEQDIVLLVDDSPESLGFLTSALEDAGVTLLVAKSGETALDIVGRVVPDVVLMDAVMPGLDGFDTCRRMKGMSALAHVPIIFMTGLTETEHIVHALESGGVDYLTKPINLDELRARIRVHLANARRARSAQIALDATGRHLLALSPSGQVMWSTPQTDRLVASLGFEQGLDAVLVQPFAHWQEAGAQEGARLVVEGNLSLSYLGQVGNQEYLFRAARVQIANPEDALKAQFGVTQRESEVLLWITRGKANKDIGDILGLSPRTVNKHLEQVYNKLGVENRASAAVKALHVLQAQGDA